MKERRLSLGRGRLPIRRTYDMGMAVAVAWFPMLIGGVLLFESLSVAFADEATLNQYGWGHGGWHYSNPFSYVATGLAEGLAFLASAWLLVSGASNNSGRQVAWGVALGAATFTVNQLLAHATAC